mmetsp:Transcript_20493/g.57004  ORF Transcript_20493/g.57004 Transcript_20493/m.57004 type:complete len:260 (-) Transcript_20493:10-789(-)
MLRRLRVLVLVVLSRREDETDLLQQADALGADVALRALSEELELTALAFDPDRERWILRVLGGDVAVLVLLAEKVELLELLVPRGLVRVPHEAQLFQHELTVVGHAGGAAGLLEFVLATLSLDPVRQRRVLLVFQRNARVSMFLHELLQLLVPLVPFLNVRRLDARVAGAVLRHAGDQTGSAAVVVGTARDTGCGGRIVRHVRGAAVAHGAVVAPVEPRIAVHGAIGHDRVGGVPSLEIPSCATERADVWSGRCEAAHY